MLLRDTDEMSEFLKGALLLEGSLVEAGVRIREASKEAYGPLLDVRLMLVAAVKEILSGRAGVPGATDAATDERLLLITVFVQGIAPIESMISEGQYVKAAAAMKQDYEILARLGEITLGKQKHGVTPNVRYAPPGTQRLYGDLNDVAHISKSEILKTLVAQFNDGRIVGISPVPKFVEEVARSLYALHVYLIIEICREMLLLHLEMYGETESYRRAGQVFVAALKMVERAGWVKSHESTRNIGRGRRSRLKPPNSDGAM